MASSENVSKGLSQYDARLKLVIVGDSGVGKTVVLVRFVDDEFYKGSYPTIGEMCRTQGREYVAQ